MLYRQSCVALVATALVFQEPSRYAVTGTVDVNNQTLVSATVPSPSRVLVGTYVPLHGPSAVRLVDERGGHVWERKLAGKLLSLSTAQGRALMVVSDSPDVLRAEVVSLQNGREIRSVRVRVPLDQELSLSRAGDAIVLQDDPIQSGGDRVTIRLIDSETSRTIEAGFQVVGAAAANQARVFIGSYTGQVDAYSGRTKLWTRSLRTRLDYYGLSCSLDGKVVLVRSYESPVVVLDGATGQELLHFRLGQDLRGWLAEHGLVVDSATATAITGFRPLLSDDGMLSLVSDATGTTFEIDPVAVSVTLSAARAEIVSALQKRGRDGAGAVRRTDAREPQIRLSSDGQTAVTLHGDALVILSRR